MYNKSMSVLVKKLKAMFKRVKEIIKSCFSKLYFFILPSLTFLFNFLRLQRIYFFFKYLFHRYDSLQFSPLFVRENLRKLMRVKNGKIWLSSTSKGELIELCTPFSKALFYSKNLLLLGAPQSRVIEIINLTFVTICIEV